MESKKLLCEIWMTRENGIENAKTQLRREARVCRDL